jgi:predicted nucleotidyltransferase
LFQRPVDLVVASAIHNPYFRQAVESTRTLIYAA